MVEIHTYSPDWKPVIAVIVIIVVFVITVNIIIKIIASTIIVIVVVTTTTLYTGSYCQIIPGMAQELGSRDHPQAPGRSGSREGARGTRNGCQAPPA